MRRHLAAGWSIRRFRASDIDACVDVYMDGYRDFEWRSAPVVRVSPIKAAISGSRVWVAEERRAGVVGFITLEPQKAYVHYLFVHRDWRFCGIGRGLLEAARDFVGKPLELNVDAPNRFARAAYEALGWTETGERSRESGVLSIRLRSP
ncbi:MAG: GNAT family N-acetyltransferase [Pseudomonadota bacterium]